MNSIPAGTPMFSWPQTDRSPCMCIQVGEYIRPGRCWLFKATALSSIQTAVSVLLLPRCCSLQYFCYSHNTCFCLVGLKLAIIICEIEDKNNCTEGFSSESNLNLPYCKDYRCTYTIYNIYNTININTNFYNL